ncbi:anti-sigma F factor [Clostridium cylindrosporum]|uniref:Anti-sigma F factor n=1 Tax=Clostridium cylindrosporum DSM 605 TaxID=1121307 RepID=A0A0J8DEG0_CLOCY|nr:anti-sigma F factor [Clostridium cylindrosporum]KMT22578.1 anti-sigma F factor SpoIIAB [Clostridium cylindrosporum DSM 605]
MFENHMKLEFPSISENEAFARIAVAAFASQLDPTIEELSDVKTAVSEAVTNAIIHGYENSYGNIIVECEIKGNVLTVEIRDFGHGISDIDLAKQPLYTSKPELERSGMGFTVMESFMDGMEVETSKEEGTKVKLIKIFKSVSV